MTNTLEQAPVNDGGVRDAVETAIDLAKGLDTETWAQRSREVIGRIPTWTDAWRNSDG